jgi:DNA-binding transcriptional ArsR family regulator
MDASMSDLIPHLKALADETRFRIIHLLLAHGLCVGALAAQLGISKAAVSQHLQILRKAGLVKGEKRGYWTHYSVDRSAVRRIGGELMKRADRASEFRGACHRSTPEAFNTVNVERREFPMCKDCCQQPVRLKGKPEECSPEQIRECHGDEKGHPCIPEKEAN